MIIVTLLDWQSFGVNVVEAPVVVVVSRRSVTSEVVALDPCVVDVGDVVVAHLVSILEKHVNTVVVSQEVTNSVGIWVSSLNVFVHPVVCVTTHLLRGLSSPWIMKISSLTP